MSMYTKGPYQLHSATLGHPVTGDGSVCITRSDGGVIAHLVPKDSEEVIANGRLLTAAPELLLALGNLVDYATGVWAPESEDDLQFYGIDPARSAIAKATEGRSSRK